MISVSAQHDYNRTDLFAFGVVLFYTLEWWSFICRAVRTLFLDGTLIAQGRLNCLMFEQYLYNAPWPDCAELDRVVG